MTTPPEIPEVIVEKAARARHDACFKGCKITVSWDDMPPAFRSANIELERAALEAAAPSLRAQGMREAVEFIAEKLFVEDYYLIKELILARAAEIEGGKG